MMNQVAVKRYPWSHLFTSEEEESEEYESDNDVMDHFENIKKLGNYEEQIQRLQKQLDEKERTLAELQRISVETFENLRGKIRKLEDEGNRGPLHQIKPVILTHSVIAHKANLDKQQSRKKVIEACYHWLKQRQQVVKYLKKHDLFADEISKFHNSFKDIGKDDLVHLVNQYII